GVWGGGGGPRRGGGGGVWWAGAGARVVRVAPPPLSVPVPMGEPPSRKVTVPVGVPVPGATGATVALKVTRWPKTEGLAEEVTVVERKRVVREGGWLGGGAGRLEKEQA